MGLFKPSTWGINKVIKDIKNYRDFKRTIKQEKSDPNSKFNKWKLNHNFFYSIYFTYDVEDTEAQLPDKIMRMRMIESLAPLHRYLDEELGFAECLVPEFNQFYDDEGKPTLTYLIVYRFAFNKLSLGWVIKSIIKLGILITGILLFINRGGLEWVQGLI